MCGIFGYIGERVERCLLKGLNMLEYRGYDSAGIAVVRDKKLAVTKEVGKVENLKLKVKERENFGVGIAHTRWATHGKVNFANAHPQLSENRKIALVHNGIIENYEVLKGELEKEGVKFDSDTDSEVIVKLIGEKLTLEKINYVMEKLEGSYAFAMISKLEDKIYFAKDKSPLYIAKFTGHAMVASDPSCFAQYCTEYYDLCDGEYGYISKNTIAIYKNGQRVKKRAKVIDFKYSSHNLDGFNHYMIKEIYQSGEALQNIIDRFGKKKMKDYIKNIAAQDIEKIYLIGCGTAYHAALIGRVYLKNYTDFEVECEYASEFVSQRNRINSRSLCIFISQSGETADTIAALKFCRERGALTLTITNVEYSTLAKLSNFVLPICAGQERAVASTKAYFGQCLILYILAKVLACQNYIASLKEFSKVLNYGDDEQIEKITNFIYQKNELFFIGRGIDYITCQEASLKLKEISYINSQALPSGELKHGTLALIDKNSIVISVITDRALFKKSINNACEIKSRGGKLILFTSLTVSKEIEEIFDYIFKIKEAPYDFIPLQTIIPLQKLAYFTSLKRGNNPDMPRNLAKSVTVE